MQECYANNIYDYQPCIFRISFQHLSITFVEINFPQYVKVASKSRIIILVL